MKILTVPNPVLISKSEEVTDFNYANELFIDMKQVAIDNNLIGMAASQIGILKCMFIVNFETIDNTPKWKAFINPKIKFNQAKGKEFAWESCGSIPNVSALVERHKEIDITAQNLQGEIFSLNLQGIWARVCQHEYSHNQGILITKIARQIKRL